MRPKADAAWHLHELTAGLRPGRRSCCSPRPRHLRQRRARATTPRPTRSWTRWPPTAARRGCPRQSLAWGLWADASGMTGHLGEVDLARMRRAGMSALCRRGGLALLDPALRPDEPLLVPARLDLAALRPAATGRPPPAAAAAGPARPPGPARRRRGGRAAARSGWPRCPAARTGPCCWTWSGPRRRRAGARPAEAVDPAPRLPRPRASTP